MLLFDLGARVCILSNWVEDGTLQHFFLINLYLFDLSLSLSIFSGIVCIGKLYNFAEGICLLNNGCCVKWKKDTISVVIATVAKSKKILHQK